MKSLDELLSFTLATLNAVGDMISKQEAGDAIERAFQDYHGHLRDSIIGGLAAGGGKPQRRQKILS